MMNKTRNTILTGAVTVGLVAAGIFLLVSNTDKQNVKQPGAKSPGLVGSPLPEIKLTDKNGKLYSLDSLKGKNVVLFFSEGLMCYPACWNQITAFGKDERFNGNDTIALSVVVDTAADWRAAIEKMPELDQAITLFDGNARAAKRLGLLTAGSSMHTGSLPGHTYILLDKRGVVRYIYDDVNMAVNNEMLLQQIAGFN